jgi:hypothetical protein
MSPSVRKEVNDFLDNRQDEGKAFLSLATMSQSALAALRNGGAEYCRRRNKK